MSRFSSAETVAENTSDLEPDYYETQLSEIRGAFFAGDLLQATLERCLSDPNLPTPIQAQYEVMMASFCDDEVRAHEHIELAYEALEMMRRGLVEEHGEMGFKDLVAELALCLRLVSRILEQVAGRTDADPGPVQLI